MTTKKKVQALLDEVNRKGGSDIRLIQNNAPYGLSDFVKGMYVWPNLFNGSLKECHAFLSGMLQVLNRQKDRQPMN